jgi:actin-like ATPase involved in cell morphogenesis
VANSFLGRDMAVDLGTANTLVYVRGRGVLLNEPSVVALDAETQEILAVGSEAKQMLGRTPGGITAIRPLKDGVIADFESTEQMLRLFIQRVHRRRYFAKPRPSSSEPSRKPATRRAPGASTSSRSRWRPRSVPGFRCTRPPGTWWSTWGEGPRRSP